MINYKPIKVTINISGLVKVIFNLVVWYHGFFDLIIFNKVYYLFKNFDYFFIISLILNEGS